MLNLTVQILLFYLMLLIGLSLTPLDLMRIRRYPVLIAVVTVAQLLILPLLAYALILIFTPPHNVAIGMLLVSICPSGALSNFYSLIAKADTALSLTLTAVSSFVAVFLLPAIVVYFYPNIMGDGASTTGLFSFQVMQLGMMILLPVLIGIILRNMFAHKIVPMLPVLERIGFLGLLLLIVAILVLQKNSISEQFFVLVLMAGLFTILAMFMAYILSRLLRVSSMNATVIVFEFPVRNMAVAATVALTIFGSSEYLAFAALFIIIQTPIMLALVFWRRNKISQIF